MATATTSWPKTCRCGEAWSRAEWAELPPIGRYRAGRDGWLELRTCVCGYAIAITLGDEQAAAASSRDG
jgi:hypothetical protein